MPTIDPRTLNRLHDAAHAAAPRLRSEAIADFWCLVGSLLRRAAVRVRERARRTAARTRVRRAHGVPCA